MNYEEAKKRVEALKGFYVHLAVYIIVIGMLFVFNFFTGGVWWFTWPAIGWGTALLLHGMALGFESGILGKDWEERKIKQLMAKHQ